MNSLPYASHLLTGIFAVAVATTLGGAVIAVMTTRLIRAVCGLMMSCVGLAGLYYFLHSPFLALMEILIYVGAVCVTIVFAVMLAEPDEPALKTESKSGKLWTALAIVIAALIALAVSRLSLGAPWPAAPLARLSDGSVQAIGRSLLTTYAFAFELISLVLLVAILGALAIARGGRNKTPMTPEELGIVAADVTRPLPPPQAEQDELVTSAGTRDIR